MTARTTRTTRLLGVLATALLAAGCLGAQPEETVAQRTPAPEAPSVAAATPAKREDTQRKPPRARSAPGPARTTAGSGGPRRFWVNDRRRYRSPWYAGARRRMIGFGCTSAPYYSPDPGCTRNRGFHHGLDMAMPCGTPLFSGLRGRVVDPGSAGSLGTAYGRNAFRIRNHRFRVDIVIGHTRKVLVRPGRRVRRTWAHRTGVICTSRCVLGADRCRRRSTRDRGSSCASPGEARASAGNDVAACSRNLPPPPGDGKLAHGTGRVRSNAWCPLPGHARPSGRPGSPVRAVPVEVRA